VDFGAEGFDAQDGLVGVGVGDQFAGATFKGSVGDANRGSGLEGSYIDTVGIGAFEQQADGLNFFVADFRGFAAPVYTLADAGVFENTDALLFIDVGEDVAGEQGFGDFFPAVAPFDLDPYGGAVDFVVLLLQACGHFEFVAGSGIEGAPGHASLPIDQHAGFRDVFEFMGLDDHDADFAFYEALGFVNERGQVGSVQGFGHDGQVNDVGVEPAGELPGEVDAEGFAQFAGDLVEHLVYPEVFHGQALQLGEQRVAGVDGIHFFVAFLVGAQDSGAFEPVEFHADGIGVFIELLFESAQVGGLAGVQEEPEQEFDAGFIGYKYVEHKLGGLSGVRRRWLGAGVGGGGWFLPLDCSWPGELVRA